MMSQFDPKNNIVQQCIQGMGMEDDGKPEEAARLFLSAWEESTNDFERFLTAFYVARHQSIILDRLKWLETSLQCALNINDDNVKSAYAALYLNIAKCYDELGDDDNAKRNVGLSESYKGMPSDKGPFYHGTKADLKVGDLLTPGGNSNYKPDLQMNHIYFTANINGAGLAAALAKGDGTQRIYIVEPTGEFENDPNVTDKKFPGNLTRSYRSLKPLKIVGEEREWVKQSSLELHQWREKLANNKGEIIN